MPFHRPSSVLLGLVLSLFMIRCAGQIPPSGGPPDTIPPVVFKTRPDSNAVRVQAGSVEIEFSEYVERRSVEESVFISPYLGTLEFDWSGRSVTISFPDSLRRNTTYVVTVGTDVKDLRANNRMESSYTLAFSTGDSLDQGSIAGRVFDNNPEGVMVFAYNLSGVRPDTLNPSHVKPDYITQTGTYGLFTLSHLAYGPYRLMAVRDQFRDLLYGKEVDQYGVTTGDVNLSNATPSVQDFYFRLTREDTTRPFLTRAEALNSRLIQLRFSEPLDSMTFDKGEIFVGDTTTETTSAILLRSVSTARPTTAWVMMETAMESGHAYRITVREVFDRAGNSIDSANASYVFETSNVPDTVKPGISVSGIRDSTRGYPSGQPLVIEFSEPVIPIAPGNMITVRLTDSGFVVADFRWLDPTTIAVIPREEFLPAAWYQLTVRLDSVRDLYGNRHSDSTYTVHFQTGDPRTTGSIQGILVDRRRDSTFHPIYVTAHAIDSRDGTPSRIRLERTGVFRFGSLREGRYWLGAFIDADTSGEYSFGSLYPFVPSERFTVLSDTLKVRARWDLEGILLEFR